MVLQHFRAFALHVVIVISCAAVAFCATNGDSKLKALLQEGVDRGYPGIAMLVQSGD